MEQLTIEDAIARRDDGIARSSDHAESAAIGWKKRATGYLLEYLTTLRRGDDFLAEHVRDFARALDAPPDARAWGWVLRDAARRGVIVKAGYAPAKSSNLSPKVLWRVA